MSDYDAEVDINSLLTHHNLASKNKIWLYEGVSIYNEEFFSSTHIPQYSKTGILIQGPFVTFSFHRKVIEYYCKFFSNSPKIIVFWDTGAKDQLDQFVAFAKGKANTYFYRLSMPLHIDSNLQILSTLYGLRKALSIGCDYVFKTRSDMLFSRCDSLFKLHMLIDTFRNFTPSSQTSKIVVGSANSFIARPYCLSDFFSFGNIYDMFNMWSLPLSDGTGVQDSVDLVDNPNESAINRMSEGLLHNLRDTVLRVSSRRSEHYITSNLMKLGGFTYSSSILNYSDFIKSCIIVIDSSSLGMCWPKYGNTSSDYKYRQGFAQISEYLRTDFKMKEWSFIDWLSVYSGGKL